jgi:hypothetical protein
VRPLTPEKSELDNDILLPSLACLPSSVSCSCMVPFINHNN